MGDKTIQAKKLRLKSAHFREVAQKHRSRGREKDAARYELEAAKLDSKAERLER